mmetsp:Transcript_967/g.2940  ORF Transcript_967/g.2940 Transcript_967/m.2940 type:complete len:249 (+) Transcript_967:243-989(+)
MTVRTRPSTTTPRSPQQKWMGVRGATRRCSGLPCPCPSRTSQAGARGARLRRGLLSAARGADQGGSSSSRTGRLQRATRSLRGTWRWQHGCGALRREPQALRKWRRRRHRRSAKGRRSAWYGPHRTPRPRSSGEAMKRLAEEAPARSEEKEAMAAATVAVSNQPWTTLNTPLWSRARTTTKAAAATQGSRRVLGRRRRRRTRAPPTATCAPRAWRARWSWPPTPPTTSSRPIASEISSMASTKEATIA